MKIVLVRHAEVEEPYIGCYNGHIDIGLSQRGKIEAKKLAQKLKKFCFQKAFCSDLKRAKETLAALELECEVIYTPKLREKSWGRHEGKRFEEIQKEGIVYTTFDEWIAKLDGESLQSYTKRVVEYFFQTIAKERCNTILVMTHAGVIKTLLSYHEKITLEEAFSIALPYSSYVVYDTIKQQFFYGEDV